MNGYGSLDTDAAIGTILSNFSTEYVNHVISDSLQMKFRPFDGPMPNYVDILNRQLLSVYYNSPDYKDKVNEVRVETFREIILKICSYYQLSFIGDFDNMSPDEILGIAHVLYDIFISRFTDYMIDFFVSYIVQNADGIAAYLTNQEESNKPKESGLYEPKNYIDPKFIIIHANINQVIYNMASYDISLANLLLYFIGDKNMANRIISVISDCGDIYRNFYASYILDTRYSAGLLTNIKLKLQAKTTEAIKF